MMTIKQLVWHFRAARWILFSFICKGDDGVVPSLMDQTLTGPPESQTEADLYFANEPEVAVAVYDILEMFDIEVETRVPKGINPMRFIVLKTETHVGLIERITGYIRFLNMEALTSTWDVTGDDVSCDLFRELMCESGINLAHFALVHAKHPEVQGKPIMVGDYRVRFTDFNNNNYLQRTVRAEGKTVVNALGWLRQQTETPDLNWAHVANVYCFFWHSMTCLMGMFDTLEDDRRYFLLLLTLIHDLNNKSNTLVVLTPHFVNREAAKKEVFLVWPQIGREGDKARSSVFAFVSRAIDIMDKFEHNVSVSGSLSADEETEEGKRARDLFSADTHFYIVCKMFIYVKRLLFEGLHTALQVGLFSSYRGIIPYGSVDIEQDRMDPVTFPGNTFNFLRLSADLVQLSKGSVISFFASLMEREVLMKKGLEMNVSNPVVQRMLKGRSPAQAIAAMSSEEFFVLLLRILTVPVPTGMALSEIYLHAHRVCYSVYPRVTVVLPTDTVMFTAKVDHDEMAHLLMTRDQRGQSYFTDTPLQLTM